MGTDYLLAKLRCAECRQIGFERFLVVMVNVSLIVLGGVLGWLLTRRSE